MGSMYAKDLVDLANEQIGYQADGKYNKYAEELDSINYFNMGAKNGVADWCAIFFCWLAYKSAIPDPDKWDAHYFLFQPDKGENLAASCGWAAQYYMDNDAWTDNPERGDQVFFVKSNGVYYHTGIVVDWNESGIYTIEGNTNGGKVAKKFYSYDDPKIAGYGRPRYDGWDISDKPSEPSQETQATDYSEIIDRLAHEVIEGKYGNYPLRKQRINALGYGVIYGYVQKRVNELLYG